MKEIDSIIEGLKQKVIEKEKEVRVAKLAVNSVCKMYGRKEIYSISDETTLNVSQLKGDEYYGRPLATVITEILEKRKIMGAGPAAIREVFEEMKAGGYEFRAKNEDNAIRGIRISMTKNPKFHQLRTSGKFGLKIWYPAAKEAQVNKGAPKKRGRPRKNSKEIAKETIDENE